MNDKMTLSLFMPITMAFLLVCLTNTGFCASELDGFFDIHFYESIHQTKFKSLIECLSEKGISPSDVRDYDMKKNLYVKNLYVYKYKPSQHLSNPFRTIDTVFIKTNPSNGRIKTIFATLAYAYNDKATEEVLTITREIVDYIQTKYRPFGIQTVTQKSNPNFWKQISQAQFGTSEKDQPLSCYYYCFKNNAGIITQIITVAVVFDEENQIFYIKIQAEETADKHKLIEQQKTEDAHNEKRWKEEVASMPEVDSFCGIKFGSVIKGGYKTRIGGAFRCLSAEVELSKPFRGIDTARVYAGIKTKRIFEIKIGPFDDWDEFNRPGQSWMVVAKKFNPNHNPLIQGYRGYYDGRLDFAPTCEIQLKNVLIDTVSSRIGTGEFEPVITEIRDYAVASAKEKTQLVYFIHAMHKKYKAMAEDESKTDDGSDVL